MARMDLSLLDDSLDISCLLDDSLASKAEDMDVEVTQILKKWNLSNPVPRKHFEIRDSSSQQETFDSRTFTRSKRRIFTPINPTSNETSTVAESEKFSMESGIASVDLQVGGPMSSILPVPMQRSWLNDVSPPSSICTSMDFQNCDNMLNSLITSSDFTNVSFLLNGTDANETKCKNSTISIDNITPTRSVTKNLMDFTFNINRTISVPSNSTFTANTELSKFGLENADIRTDSVKDFDKNRTFNAEKSGKNLSYNELENVLNATIIQSTPVYKEDAGIFKNFDRTMSPISRVRDDEDEMVILRNIKSRNLANELSVDDYRNSIEDQCEFILNEETIKLSSRVCGDTLESVDLKTALIESTSANEREFDKMLDSFDMKKSLDSFNVKRSVDNIKQRHSLINLEKQREEKQRKDEEYDNKNQYDAINKSSERLLRRSRVYDDVNLQLQKDQIEALPNKMSCNDLDTDSDHIVDKNNRDRFKTIKLNKKLQSGMVVVDSEQNLNIGNEKSTSPGTNKERRNKLNLQKQDMEDTDFKKPSSGLSKFGFSRPTYSSRNNLNLPLKACSTDSLDNEETEINNMGVNLKSPMGIKSKSIHNLMFNGNTASSYGYRMGSYSNLKLISGATKSQSNLKAPRASSLVRPSTDNGFKPSATHFISSLQSQKRAPSTHKPNSVRPSSGYYPLATKRIDSDSSLSSAGSRNSVHIPTTLDQQQFSQQNQFLKEPDHSVRKAHHTGTIPKLSGLRPPSNLRPPRASGLPRPSNYIRK